VDDVEGFSPRIRARYRRAFTSVMTWRKITDIEKKDAQKRKTIHWTKRDILWETDDKAPGNNPMNRGR